MNCITNEIERSQRGGALNAGCGAAPEYLPELKDNISAAREIAREYCNLTITNKKNRNYIVCYFVHLIIGANKLLPIYINELRKGLRMEAFPISSEMHGDDVFWKWCDTVCRDMERHKVYHYLKESIDKLKALLADAEKAMMHCDPTLFERFFYREEQHYNSCGVKRKFDMWLYDDSYPDIDKLRELQAQVVAETLKMGVMDFAKMPSQKEIDEVKLDYLTSLLPCDFEVDENFKIACAQWRRFMHWEGTILVIDYKKYGKYIQAHFYEFSDKQLQAIFELDMMLKLIHQEMARLKAKTEAKHTVLKSETAMKYWRRLMKLGLVDSNCQLLPDTSRQQAMYIVEPFAEKLDIKNQWKPFEDLWGIKNLAQEKWKFQQTGILPPIHQDIDKVFKD